MDQHLRNLIELLKGIEKKAREIYLLFRKRSVIPHHKDFWAGLAKEESVHAAFWEKLKKTGEKRPLKNPFYDLQKTINQTIDLQARVTCIKESCRKLDTQEAFLRNAIILETILLNPALTVLFRSASLQIKRKSPEATYQDHIRKLVDFARENMETPDFLLYSLALESAFEQSLTIADQISRIDGLEAIIPICAWCKNVRKKDGKWVRIEAYIKDHTQSEFTHGICPDCEHKL